VAAEAKMPPINNVAALKAKLNLISKSNLPWVERLDVTALEIPAENSASGSGSAAPAESSAPNREDDFKREISFYDQAQNALEMAIPKLRQFGVATERPSDYFAEMAKSDKHMTKVRQNLLNYQTRKEKSETAKKLRDERKFAGKVNKEALQKRISEKRQLKSAVKKHQKGLSAELNDILEEKKNKMGHGKNVSKKREWKNEKFGYGGKKRGQKWNTRDSAGQLGNFNPARNSKIKSAKGKGKKKRLGKSKRQNAKSLMK